MAVKPMLALPEGTKRYRGDWRLAMYDRYMGWCKEVMIPGDEFDPVLFLYRGWRDLRKERQAELQNAPTR